MAFQKVLCLDTATGNLTEVSSSDAAYLSTVSGQGSGGALVLQSTDNSTKGKIYFGSANTYYFDEANSLAVLPATSFSGVITSTTISGINQFNSTLQIGQPGADRSILFGGTNSGLYWGSLTAPSNSLYYNVGNLIVSGGSGGYGLIVNNTLTAGTIKKNGGTALQFLKADGSIDATTYLNAANNLSDVANVTTAVANLGLTIGTNVQAYNASTTTLGNTTTGTGNIVRATSPTLTTPNLGTPSTLVLTSATGLPLTTGVTGVLPIANGGTNNSTAYTAGSVIFSDGTQLNQSNSKLFWDNTNNRLGIGTATPADVLEVRKDQVSSSITTVTKLLVTNANASGIAALSFSDGATPTGGLQYNNTTGSKNLFSATYTDIPYYFGTNNAIKMTIGAGTSSGNIGIGTTAPTHALTFPSASTGIALYNTTDQTTNYERLRMYWNSNVATIASEKGGTGSSRTLQITNGVTTLNLLASTNQISTNSVQATSYFFSALSTAPATSTSSGTLGDMRIDGNYLYFCKAANTWVRAALATF